MRATRNVFKAVSIVLVFVFLFQFAPASYSEGSVDYSEQLKQQLVQELLDKPHLLTGPSYPDILQDFWGIAEIEYLSDKGIIDGRPSGVYDPDSTIKNGEFLKLVLAALEHYGITPEGEESGCTLCEQLRQKIETHWIVEHGWYDKGISSGVLNPGDYGGTYNPETPITRLQMARMMVRARQLAGQLFQLKKMQAVSMLEESFEDGGVLEGSNAVYMASAVLLRYITGFTDNTLRPYENATRAQAAVITWRLVNDLLSIETVNAGVDSSMEYDEWAGEPQPDALTGIAEEIAAMIEGGIQQNSMQEYYSCMTELYERRYGLLETEFSGKMQSIEAVQTDLGNMYDTLEDTENGLAYYNTDNYWNLEDFEDEAAFAAYLEEETWTENERLEGLNTGAENLEDELTGLEYAMEENSALMEMYRNSTAQCREELDGLYDSLAEYAEENRQKLNCRPIKEAYDKLKEKLDELKQRLEQLRDDEKDAKDEYDRLEAAAVQAEKDRDDVKKNMEDILDDIRDAVKERKDLYKTYCSGYGWTFDAPADKTGMNYMVITFRGVVISEVYIDRYGNGGNATLRDYLEKVDNMPVNARRQVRDIWKRIRDAKKAYKEEEQKLEPLEEAAREAREKADGAKASLDELTGKREDLEAQISNLEQEMAELEAKYSECIERNERIDRTAREGNTSYSESIGNTTNAENDVKEAARNRWDARKILDGIKNDPDSTGETDCPEARSKLKESDEYGAEAREKLNQAREELRRMMRYYEQAMEAYKRGMNELAEELIAKAGECRQNADRLIEEAEALAEAAKRISEEAKELAEDCEELERKRRQQAADDAAQQQQEQQGGQNSNQISGEEAQDLADLLDRMEEEQDYQEKTEMLLEIVKLLSEYRASGKTLPAFLASRVSMGSTAASGIIGLGISLVSAGPCPWVAVIVAKIDKIRKEKVLAAVNGEISWHEVKYYMILHRHWSSYYMSKCVRGR